MGNVRVVADSGCDLPPALCDELGIDIVPLTIRFGDEVFVDRKDLDPPSFWARCQASSTLPETAAPSPGAFEDAYRRAADAGADGVVVITLSRKMSATIQAAELAAESVAPDIPVRVIDSTYATMAEGLVADEAARAAAAGKSLDDVVAHAEATIDRVDLVACLDTLENLRKGGRIGGAQAMLGGLLSIKPLVTVRDGEVAELGKQRTRAKALTALFDKLKARGSLERLAVMHAQANDIDEILDRLAAIFPREETIVAEVGPVIGTHAGPGCVGFISIA